jgi:hypothetical protein
MTSLQRERDPRKYSLSVPATVAILSQALTQGSFQTVSFEEFSHLREIGRDAFKNHQFLTSICIPASVQVLSRDCFRGCGCLRHFAIAPGSVLSRIEDWAFSWSSIESIVVPSTVEFVKNSCFAWCKSLSAVLFESGCLLRSLRKCAFLKCSTLQSFRSLS